MLPLVRVLDLVEREGLVAREEEEEAELLVLMKEMRYDAARRVVCASTVLLIFS